MQNERFVLSRLEQLEKDDRELRTQCEKMLEMHCLLFGKNKDDFDMPKNIRTVDDFFIPFRAWMNPVSRKY